MNSATRIELLNKENFDTWKMQMQALLTKNDLWQYVNGKEIKPEPVVGDLNRAKEISTWEKNDEKTKSEIILSICASELKQVKGCKTSKEMWNKLEGIYQSKGPARKSMLLEQLIQLRMEENSNVREHINKFFDTVDKLTEMEVDLNQDLLSVMLLCSLPRSYENFRCAIKSRDELPSLENLRVKITEESDSRGNESSSKNQNVLFVQKHGQKHNYHHKNKVHTSEYGKGNSNKNEKFPFQCHRCRMYGHKAINCKSKNENQQFARKTEDLSLGASETFIGELESRKWCLDSGATSHICKELKHFGETQSGCGKLNLANQDSTEIKAKGNASFFNNYLGSEVKVNLKDTLYVPDLRTNLISVAKITENGYDVLFTNNHAKVIDKKGKTKLIAKKGRGLYYFNESANYVSDSLEYGNAINNNKLLEWHRKLGHLNFADLKKIQRDITMKGLNFSCTNTNINCEICLQGKMTRTPFQISSDRSTDLLEIIHSDVCGPMRTESLGGAKYCVTFIDDHSRWTEVRLIRSKDEVFKHFKEFKQLVENQKEKRIKQLHTDNGGEYINITFNDFLKEHGISRRCTVAYNPEQNGICERKNRTLYEMARCLLIQAKLPPMFWAEAVSTANYIRNRVPTSSLQGKTPYQLWTGKLPDVRHFHEFGSKVYCLSRKPGIGKLEPRGQEGIFLGYAQESKGYRIWIPSIKQVVISRDIKVINTKKPLEHYEAIPEDFFDSMDERLEVEKQNPPIEVIMEPHPLLEENINQPEQLTKDDSDDLLGSHEEEETSQESERRGPGRPRLERTGARGRPTKVYNMITTQTGNSASEFAFLSEVPIKNAVYGAESEDWYKAMALEMKSIIKNNTWETVSRPDNVETIGSRFVLRNKFNSDGSIQKKKARIVAQGFVQKPGIHFNETFAPVSRLSSIRLLISIATQAEMKIHHLDVTTAYLNSTIEETLYLEPPKYIIKALECLVEMETADKDIQRKAIQMLKNFSTGNRVLLLKKSLYGLKQSGRNWYNTLKETLSQLGAVPCNGDPCIYRIGKGNNATLIATYVDDILLLSKDTAQMNFIKEKLSKYFLLKDMGEVKYCLGIEFLRNKEGITMHQQGYINEVLHRFGMFDAKPVLTPLCPNSKLTKQTCNSKEEGPIVPYRELMGSLMYLAVSTRPDIAFAVSYLSQFNEDHDTTHWTAAKRVLRYLKGTLDLGLSFQRSSTPLKCFVDADWANCPEDRKSYTGYVTMIGSCIISWEAKKQRTVALSSTEAEYMGLAEATKEVIYLNNFLSELGFSEFADAIIFNDNLGSLKLAENPTYHARSKHIDVRHHFIRESLREKKIRIAHVYTEDMPADVLTKALPNPKHLRCIELLKLKI